MTNIYGNSPLHDAAFAGNVELVKQLIGAGEDLNILNKDDDSYGQSTIPHLFRTPFYCYAYAFGNILSLSLYNMYNVSEDKEEFKTVYKKILKSGGLHRPKKLLSKYGIDIDGKPFYDNLKNEIEKLLKQI